ncbi:MAG: hypothetical protein QF464_00115 [Myxococcota bacterium]|jgi:class 3 adenylate cyclase|nr:hypothetical protein [Myxococcota bacterium]
MSEPDPGRPVVKTLVLTDFVDSTKFVSALGDVKAAEIFAEHDHAARALLAEHGGQEIDKSDGFLFLFDRPIDAVRFCLAYHRLLARLSEDLPRPLEARSGIHLGEVVMRSNPTDDVVRGAKPVEVEGLAKAKTARVMACAFGGQTLLSESAYAIGHRAAVGAAGLGDDVRWVEHGLYNLKGIDEPVRLYEVGREGEANMVAPVGRLVEESARHTGIISLVALVVAIAGFLFAWQQSSSTPAPATAPPTPPAPAAPVAPAQVAVPVEAAQPEEVPPPAPTSLALKITSTPPGAEIRYGDDVLGTTPLTLPVPRSIGGHPVQATLAGHHPNRAFCRITEADMAAGAASCQLTLKRVQKSRAKETAPPGSLTKPKRHLRPKAKPKPKIHMID